MKRLMLVILAVLLLAGVPLPIAAVDGETPEASIAVSRIYSKNGSEFVEIYNYSGKPIATSELNVKALRSASSTSPNFSKTFQNKTLVSDGFILIKQGGTVNDSDEAYGASSNNITNLGGIIKIVLDGQPTDDICWGDVTECTNHVTILDSEIYVTGRCLADEKCVNQPQRFGGLTDTKICEFDDTILADDAECKDPNGSNNLDPEDPETPPSETSNCANLKLNEIGVYIPEQFIEVLNPTDETINAEGCILTENYYNKEYVLPKIEIAPNGVYAITLGKNLTLIKTKEAEVFLLNADHTEIDSVKYSGLKSGEVLALIGDEWRATKESTPNTPNPMPKPINFCVGLRINEIGANLDDQFIEITADHDVNLTGCRLMTNRSTTKFYEFASEILPRGALKTINISETGLALTKAAHGIVYLIASDGTTEIDSVSYENLSKDTSWALVDSEWVQTYMITRGGVNVSQEFAACKDGYWRNLETSRCNKIVEPEVLAACPAGQYRNLETNRCRKLETASTLTPCKEGQERNPETNRCRKIATEDDGPKPCAEGWERNPETNRCRKKVSTTPATFAVQPGDPTGSGTAYMLAAGGVIAATLGVILFQFRMEIANLTRRLMPKHAKIST